MRKPYFFTAFLALSAVLGIAEKAFAQQPANDECINAIPIPNVVNWCSLSAAFTSVGSTPSAQVNPTCFPNTTPVNDVWFSFVAQANTVNISVSGSLPVNSGGTISNPQFALYSGACSNLTLLECASDAANDNIVQSFIGQLTIGETYYIRVSARFGFRGTFRLCINNYNEVPDPSGDCATAVILCDKSSFTVPKVVGVGNQNNEIGNVGCNGPSCIISESSSTWYKWTCRDAGTLTFVLTPLNPADDLDFVVYELPNGLDNCNNKNPIRCMASGENVGQPLSSWISCSGATGLRSGENDANETCGCPAGNNNFIAPINMVAGRSYALVVNNFSNSGDGFTVEFGGTGTFLGPTANFSTQPMTACVGQPVTFTDQSSFIGTITDWTWNFGPTATPVSATGIGPHTVVFNRPGSKPVLLTVETDRGCVVSKVLTVNVECCANHFTADGMVTNLLCADQPTGAVDIQVSSAYPPYTYSWSGGQTSQDVTGLPAGSFTVTVTDQATCTRQLSFTLTQPPPLQTDTLIIKPTCNGGTDGAATLNPSGGVGPYQFNWQNSGFSNNNTLSNIPRGDYPVVIRDANNCLLPLVIPVRELELILNPQVQAIRPPYCTGESNGSIVVQIANGLPPFQYNWGNGFVSDSSLLDIPAGTYTVLVRDANLCIGEFEFNMEDHPPLQLAFTTINTRCYQESNGTATVSASGGVGNYRYAWSTGASGPMATGLAAGTYMVTVFDGNNCEISGNVAITEPDLLRLAVVDSTGLLCSYDTTGRIGIAASGGTPAYTYSVDRINFQTSSVFNDLRGGAYLFTVRDAQGCEASVTGVVTSPPPLIVDAGPDQTISLGFSADIRAVVSNPLARLSWLPPDSLSCVDCLTPVASPVRTTTYVITAIDSNNCIAIDSLTIFLLLERPVYIPNAFSPNDDGINDNWTLYGGRAVRQVNIARIFDRWGALVYERSNFPPGDEKLGWDGIFKDKMVNPGVFTYMAEVEFLDGERIRYEGDITVIR